MGPSTPARQLAVSGRGQPGLGARMSACNPSPPTLPRPRLACPHPACPALTLPALTLPALTLPARRLACPPCRVPPPLKAPASRRRWPTNTGVWSSRAWLAPSGSPRELLLSTAAAVDRCCCLGAKGGGRLVLCGEDAGGCNRVTAGAVGKGRGRAAAGTGTGGARRVGGVTLSAICRQPLTPPRPTRPTAAVQLHPG